MTSGTRPAARAASTASRGGTPGPSSHDESALDGHALTVADHRDARYARAPWSCPTERSGEELASGRLVIDPFDEALLQPSSVDVRVADEFRVFHNNRRTFIDVRQPSDDLTELVTIAGDEAFILHPGEFVLGSTRSGWRCRTTSWRASRASRASAGWGCSSTPRPGYVDPGFNGTITLELSNVARLPISIHPGHGDRPDLVPPDDDPGRAPLPGQVPGPERPDRVGVPPGVRRDGSRRSP